LTRIRGQGFSPGRWPGLVVVCLLLAPRTAGASDDLFQLQSPDGRRRVGVEETRTPIALDGALDEEVWRTAAPADGFIQAEPREGEAATEQTEVRVAFDRDALYIGVICRDATPAGLIINDIRKTSGRHTASR
jgi:hypothetical protein